MWSSPCQTTFHLTLRQTYKRQWGGGGAFALISFGFNIGSQIRENLKPKLAHVIPFVDVTRTASIVECFWMGQIKTHSLDF